MDGQKPDRPKSEEVSDRHNIAIPRYVWTRLVEEAGGERKVSELLVHVLAAYVATVDIVKKDRGNS